MKRTILGSTFVVILAAAPAFAAVEDSDGNGMYSFNEMLVAYPTLTEETFVTIDANGDGGIDAEELAAATEAGILPAG
jgi:Ca2+-binding EF-hand superfamily protein